MLVSEISIYKKRFKESLEQKEGKGSRWLAFKGQVEMKPNKEKKIFLMAIEKNEKFSMKKISQL